MADNDSEELRVGSARGPYDIDALATQPRELENSHLDLGSVLVPVVEGGQVTVEMTEDHQPQNVYLVTPIGRISVSAFAAPKSPGLWREVVRELAESLRDEGASVSIEDGHWGREVVAAVEGATHRFIGVDGPRWLVRCVGSGPTESADDLARLSRAVLAESVVRRGSEPHPPREPLPIVLPPVLAEQVAAAQQQMFADPGAAQQAPGTTPEAAGAARGAPDQVAGATVDGGAGQEPSTSSSSAPTPSTGGSGQGGPQLADPDEPEDSPPPSEGSAMQRFFRRR